MMNNFMNGMFGKIGSGMCKLSMSGNIAVKTSNGYKSYNVKSGKLTNCGNFVFPGVDENFFFVIPTNKVAKGDIILVNGKPKCVIEADKTKITVINYEDSTVETIPFSEIPGKRAFIKDNYGLPDDNIYFTLEKTEKLTVLQTLQQKLGLKPSQIAIVEDTVKTLDYIRAHSDFVTVHVSSFME